LSNEKIILINSAMTEIIKRMRPSLRKRANEYIWKYRESFKSFFKRKITKRICSFSDLDKLFSDVVLNSVIRSVWFPGIKTTQKSDKMEELGELL